MDWKKIFAERLTQIRKSRALSKTDLGLLIEVRHVQIVEYEKGRKFPSLGTFVKLVAALDCSADWLLGLSDDPPGSSHPFTKGDVPILNDDFLKHGGFAPCVDCGCTERKVLSRPFAWLAWPLTEGEAPQWPDGFISPLTGNVSAMKGYLRTCPDCGHAEWTTRPPVLADSFLADADLDSE